MQKEDKLIVKPTMKTNNTLILIIITGTVLILSLIIGYLLYVYYDGEGIPVEVNETNTPEFPVNETPTTQFNQTPTNTTNTSTTTTTGGGSNNGGGGGTTTPTCTDTCNSLGYECGNWSICGSEVNCGECGDSEVCNNGKCSGAGGPYCGDTICTGLENCTNCPQDCGCKQGETCNQGICELIECTISNNCFYVSVTGAGTHDGSLGNEMNLSDAQTYANSNLDAEIIFLVEEGEYDKFSSRNVNREKWVVYKGIGSNVILHSIYTLGGQQYIIFDNFIINNRTKGHVGENAWSAVQFYSDNMKILNSRINITNITGDDNNISAPIPHVFGVRAHKVNNVEIINNTITGGRIAIELEGDNLTVENNEISYQWGDGIRVVSAQNTIVNNNYIHDLDDYLYLNEHVDAIQFFASGPECMYPQPKDVVIKNNRLFNMPGQMLFIQANWIDCLGYIKNVTFVNNTLGKRKEDAIAYEGGNAWPIQFQGVQDFVFEHNTVDEKFVLRINSSGILKDNIIGYLAYGTTGDILGEIEEDHNLIGEFHTYVEGHDTLGENTVIGTPQYTDIENNDYRPVSQDIACLMSSDNSYVGSLPCVGCVDENPIASFLIIQDDDYDPTINFDASTSLSCLNSITSYNWDFDDGTTGEGVYIEHEYEPGFYQPTLEVTNNLGLTDIMKKSVSILPLAEPGLLAYLNFDNNLKDFSGRGLDGIWESDTETLTYVQGKVNEAVTFNGISESSVKVSGDSSLQGMDELTITIWAKKHSSSTGGVLVNKHVHYLVQIGSETIDFRIWDDENKVGQLYSDVPSINDNEWHQYTLVYDGSYVKAFVDGEEIIRIPFTGNIRSTGTWPLRLGRSSIDTENSFSGTLDEFKIYNKALTETEIQQLYCEQGGTGDFCGSLGSSSLISTIKNWLKSWLP